MCHLSESVEAGLSRGECRLCRQRASSTMPPHLSTFPLFSSSAPPPPPPFPSHLFFPASLRVLLPHKIERRYVKSGHLVPSPSPRPTPLLVLRQSAPRRGEGGSLQTLILCAQEASRERKFYNFQQIFRSQDQRIWPSFRLVQKNHESRNTIKNTSVAPVRLTVKAA